MKAVGIELHGHSVSQRNAYRLMLQVKVSAVMLFGRVDQLGMIATLASWRPRVQIPSRPPNPLSEKRLYREKLSLLQFFGKVYGKTKLLLDKFKESIK